MLPLLYMGNKTYLKLNSCARHVFSVLNMKTKSQRPVLFEEVHQQCKYTEDEIRRLPWQEVYNLRGPVRSICRVVGTSIKDFTVYNAARVLHVVGGKWFIKTKMLSSLTYKNGAFRGDLTSSLVHTLSKTFKQLDFLGLKSFVNPRMYFNLRYKLINKRTLKAILDGKITSQEGLYKFYIRTMYHHPIPWKLYREYLACGNLVSIYDIIDFTKNPETSLRAWVQNCYSERNTLMRDTLECAARLREKVDLSWSTKRLQYEHQQQIYKLNVLEIGSKDSTPMWDDIPETDEVHPLVSERNVFEEATLMQHCLYSNYYRNMKRNNYIAFSITPKGMPRATLGVYMTNGCLTIDQIRLYRNGFANDTYRDIAVAYLKHYESQILHSTHKDRIECSDDEIVLPF